MIFNPEFHHRRSIRLRDYDYSSGGAYFVTMCTHERECLFGRISVGAGSKPAQESVVQLNEFGRQIVITWQDLPNHNANLVLDAYVVMPNHVHFIVAINDRAGLEPAPTLSEIVRQFKTFSAKRINTLRDNPGVPVWQRNYYERVIRDEKELVAIRQYIADNPAKWAEDENHPSRI